MTSKQLITGIFDRKGTGSIGFWTGNPHRDTVKIYNERIGEEGSEAIYSHLEDDCRWYSGNSAYAHPDGKPMFDFTGGVPKESLNQGGVFAECTDPAEVEKHP